jgi:hypothetical protein
MFNLRREYGNLLKEATSLLELALWKAKLLDETFGGVVVGQEDGARRTRGQRKRVRMDVGEAARVTCGADIIIKNCCLSSSWNER